MCKQSGELIVKIHATGRKQSVAGVHRLHKTGPDVIRANVLSDLHCAVWAPFCVWKTFPNRHKRSPIFSDVLHLATLQVASMVKLSAFLASAYSMGQSMDVGRHADVLHCL